MIEDRPIEGRDPQEFLPAPEKVVPVTNEGQTGMALRITNCAIYVRVSTDEQAKEQHYSLAAQEEYCMGEIVNRQKEGWVYRITISDDGYSGAVFERPGLLQLLKMVKAREINAVVVYKRDRLFRAMQISTAVQAIFLQFGVRLLSYGEGLCDTSPQTVWMGQVIDAFSQLDRANIRTRVLDARRYAAKRGDWQGGIPSFGYSYEPGTRVPVINEAEAKIVRFIFQQAANGVPCDEIARELRRLGLYARPRNRRINGR